MAKKVLLELYSVTGTFIDSDSINTRFDKKKKNGKEKNEVKFGPTTYELIRIKRPFISDSDTENDLVMKAIAKAV